MSEKIIYYKITDYLLDCKTIADQIAAIDLAISKLIIVASQQAGKDNIAEYEMNNGQTVMRLQYRSVAAVTSSIMQLRQLRNNLANEANGYGFRLVDSKSLY